MKGWSECYFAADRNIWSFSLRAAGGGRGGERRRRRKEAFFAEIHVIFGSGTNDFVENKARVLLCSYRVAVLRCLSVVYFVYFCLYDVHGDGRPTKKVIYPLHD